MALSKRKRLVFITSLLTVLFLAVIYFLFFRQQKRKVYIPGAKVEGVTSVLQRPVPKNHPEVIFKDATKPAGIQFRHFWGKRTTQLPEDMGSGVAWIDYDRDGYGDLFIVNEAGPVDMSSDSLRKSPAECKLYHNNGDGTFTDVTAKAGINFKGWGMGVAAGDVDNDGWPDLFISTYGTNIFYHNNGDGTFTNGTKKSGLGGIKGFWSGASWADYDRDGYLDLYVTGYVKYQKMSSGTVTQRDNVEEPAGINPLSFQPEHNLLYHNNGNGTFRELAVQAGVADPDGKSLSATWCDFDNDGWPDLYVANDVSDNALYHNMGNQTFTEISHPAHVSDYRGAMGLAVGDWDQDGDMDLFVTHWLAEENALYVNQQNTMNANAGARLPLIFQDEAEKDGLGQVSLDYVGWGTSFFDYDNDTKQDLLVVNGSTDQQNDHPWLLVPMGNTLFWNQGPMKGFYDVTQVSGEALQYSNVSRGAAFGDYDNDGDVDVFIVNNGGSGVLLMNEGGNKKNWLEVELEGTKSNRSAIGTKLRAVTDSVIQLRQVGDQSSYLSQNSLVQHFGMGSYTHVDTLDITWPSGMKQHFYHIPSNEKIYIREGASRYDANFHKKK